MRTAGMLLFTCMTAIISAEAQPEHLAGNEIDGPDESTVVKLIDDLKKKPGIKLRPGFFGGGATIVYIDFFLRNFGALNERDMEFSLDIDFRETWIDKRLRAPFNWSEPSMPVYIPDNDIDTFWLPDVYFPNQKATIKHCNTVPNRSFRVHPNGTVRYTSRFTMRLSCTMYLAKFPFDTQKCFFNISSYAHDTSSVVLQWEDDHPIELHVDKLNLPQFELLEYRPTECKEEYKTGNYSCLTAVFRLQRKIGYFVLQVYVPSVLIVKISWIGFWISRNSDPARVSLAVTTVLTMTTIMTSSSHHFFVSYLMALDVWYAACMVFVFGALLEYAFVSVFVRREKKTASERMAPTSIMLATLTPSIDSRTTETDVNTSEEFRQPSKWMDIEGIISKWNITSTTLDRTSRRVFPLCFLGFNIIYWLWYIVFAG